MESVFTPDSQPPFSPGDICRIRTQASVEVPTQVRTGGPEDSDVHSANFPYLVFGDPMYPTVCPEVLRPGGTACPENLGSLDRMDS